MYAYGFEWDDFLGMKGINAYFLWKDIPQTFLMKKKIKKNTVENTVFCLPVIRENVQKNTARIWGAKQERNENIFKQTHIRTHDHLPALASHNGIQVQLNNKAKKDEENDEEHEILERYLYFIKAMCSVWHIHWPGLAP